MGRRPPSSSREHQRGWERGVELGGAEVEDGVTGAALDGARDAGARGGGEAVADVVVAGRGVEAQTTEGECGDA